MAKIYTKTGDDGQTGLFGGPRVSKDDPRIEAYGTVDELNAVLGVVRACGPSEKMDALLFEIQNQLFAVGAELATPDAADRGMAQTGQAQIAAIESAIDQFEAILTPLQQFILPGGTPLAAQLHFARTVCRRAERRVVSLGRQDPPISTSVLVYLNRLSDLLFVLARLANAESGCGDVAWSSKSERSS